MVALKMKAATYVYVPIISVTSVKTMGNSGSCYAAGAASIPKTKPLRQYVRPRQTRSAAIRAITVLSRQERRCLRCPVNVSCA